MTAVPAIRRRRAITGMSAVFVPYTADGAIDWPNLEAHIVRTRDAGLNPAVNMDTGYVQLLGPHDRQRVLDVTRHVTDEHFVAGAYAAGGCSSDAPGRNGRRHPRSMTLLVRS